MKPKHIYLALCGMVGFVAATAWSAGAYLDFTINLTRSLPQTLFIIHKGARVVKGDLVAYRWQGGATYPIGVVFIKQVTGMPGDVVKRTGNAFWVGDQYVGTAKPVSKAGIALKPANPGLIPSGSYFVSTSNPDSLDSRYAISGNVSESAIIGKAYAIF